MKLRTQFMNAVLLFLLRSCACFPLFAVAAQAGVGFALTKSPGGGVVITHDGAPVAEYVVDEVNKPYLQNVTGPGGHQVTRSFPMKKVAGESTDHPQHRGIYFAHQNIGGVDTWYDGPTYAEAKKSPGAAPLGSIKHREYKEMFADRDRALVVDICDLVDAVGRKLLIIEHRLEFSVDGDSRLIDSDLRLTATQQQVLIHDEKEAGFAIRVADGLSVDAGRGGVIVNSNGASNDAAWGKAASWCDYSGPAGRDVIGVAMLNHPSSFRYPTTWHVRNYGLFAANPFGQRSLNKSAPDGSLALAPGEEIVLSHRLILHRGNAAQAQIEKAFAAYAGQPRPLSPSGAPGMGNAAAGATPALAPIQTDPNQPRIEVIRDQGPNAVEWALAALDEPVPPNIRQNLTYLREDLLDEAKAGPKAPAEAYTIASDYCDKILAALRLREQARVQAGYRAAQADADIQVTNSQLDARRNYQMSWPQYHREESQRAALREKETNRADLKKERIKVDWATRVDPMRTALDTAYRQLREAMRDIR